MVNFSNETKQELMEARLLVGQLELLYSLMGVPLQIFVIYLGLRVFKKTRQKNQLIVISMTVADLIVSGIHSPMMFGLYYLGATYPFFPCYLLYFSTYIGTISSSLSLLLLNFDKFFYLRKPLHYSAIVTYRKTLLGIGICWIVSIVWTTIFLLSPATAKEKEPGCGFSPQIIGLYIVFFLLFFTLPILISFVISINIGIIVIRAQRFTRQRLLSQMGRNAAIRHKNVTNKYLSHASPAGMQRDSSLRNAPGRSKSGTPMLFKRRSEMREMRSSLKSILFVFSTTIWAVLTVLPYRIGYILSKAHLMPITGINLIVVMHLFMVMTFNPVGNPIITIITQRSYMEMIRSIYHGWCGKRAGNAANKDISSFGCESTRTTRTSHFQSSDQQERALPRNGSRKVTNRRDDETVLIKTLSSKTHKESKQERETSRDAAPNGSTCGEQGHLDSANNSNEWRGTRSKSDIFL